MGRRRLVKSTLATFVGVGAVALTLQVSVASAYNAIVPRDAGRTVTLDGKNLTLTKLVAIARYGAKVQLTHAARQRSLNAYYLLLEGSREGIPIYFFNRGTGAGRQVVLFKGDPLSTAPIHKGRPGYPSNQDFVAATQLASFQFGQSGGLGLPPQVNDEEIVRAMMAVRVSTMSYEAATPQVTQMLMDLLNHDVTPVVESRGSPGEGDLPQMDNVEATMVGVGQAYFHGTLMSSSQALAKAGLQPLQKQRGQFEAPIAPFGADDAALTSTNAYSTGQAALLAYDAERTLNWQDLITAQLLDGMNSSITPESAPVQADRPFRWLNYDASKVTNELTGSYLFNVDQVSATGSPFRIIQDPESLRAITQRTGAVWNAWNTLRSDLALQMNSSDHNPSVTPGFSPSSSPELRTPWLRQYYVKGGPDDRACVGGGVGPATGCRHGYIMSNANWDPYPMDNDIEALTNAFANVAVNDVQIPDRFQNQYPSGGGFTVISGPTDPSLGRFASTGVGLAPQANDYDLASLEYEILAEQNPVPPLGDSIVSNVEDLQAASTAKVARARLMVDEIDKVLGEDMLTATYWMNTRQLQGEALAGKPGSGVTRPRAFGAAPTAAWRAFRKVVPWQVLPPKTRVDATVPADELAYDFIQANPASMFYSPDAVEQHVGGRAQPTHLDGGSLRPAVQAALARTSQFERTSVKAKALHAFLTAQAQITGGNASRSK